MADPIRYLGKATPINSLAAFWIRDYRASRYLKNLNRVELDERTADIVSNLLLLGDDGKYRPQYRAQPDSIYAPIRNLDFLRMATDVWEEARLRGYGTQRRQLDPSRLQIAKRLGDESWCRRPDWVADSRLSSEQYERPRILFRFSKAEWNLDFLRNGRVRFSPASHYNDTGAIGAVRDDELRLQWYDGTLTSQVAEANDYYAFCLSSQYDYRLFTDFQSDSCVAIRDAAALSLRLRNAIAQHNKDHRDTRIRALFDCPVIYVDPFLLAPPTTGAEVHFCKHFRFAYQTEFRFVLTPATTRELRPFFVELGSIEDIAEIVTASGSQINSGSEGAIAASGKV